MQTTAVPRYALNAESIALNAPMIFAKTVNFVPNVPIFLTAAETVYTVQRLRVYSFVPIAIDARIAPKVFAALVVCAANALISVQIAESIVQIVPTFFVMTAENAEITAVSISALTAEIFAWIVPTIIVMNAKCVLTV